MTRIRSRSDFTFNVSALGYTIYYKGVAVGVAALPVASRTKENLSGRAARVNRRKFGETAENVVCACVSGTGPEHVMQALDRVDAEASCRKSKSDV